MPGTILHALFELWCERNRIDEYIGSLINAYVSRGGEAYGVRAGEAYVDVGTLHGYRAAINLLAARSESQRLSFDVLPARLRDGKRTLILADDSGV
jgi:tRNA (mo5U34)-methyltransferase